MIKAICGLVLMLCLIPVAALAQGASEQPPPSVEPLPPPAYDEPPPIVDGIQELMSNHLSFGILASYDWVAGDWGRPWAIGPAASWTINDNLAITWKSEYIVNSHVDRWRSQIGVFLPIYGGSRLK